MTRDKLRDKKYFEELIKDEERRINKFMNVLKADKEVRDENDYGVQRVLNYVFGIHINKLEAIFSSGAPLDDIKASFPNVINVAEKIWTAESQYVEMIDLLSIGIMLNIKRSEMDRLKMLIKKDGVQDYLIDFLLHTYDESWEIRTTSFKHDRPYIKLYDVINSRDKKNSTLLLKGYLENYWYEGHDDAGWYDTHNKKDELIYSGYWSFESGAIAKILDLDDRLLKDTPYYPFDMVHYHDE